MKLPPCSFAFVAALLLASPATLPAASAASDLLPPARRQIAVDMAERLTRPPQPAAVPADLPRPFNPPDFNQPDPEEIKAAAAAGTPLPTEIPGVAAGPVVPAGPITDREILEEVAARLTPSGTVVLGSRAQLIIGTNRFEVGTRFGVLFNNQEYELELISIDRTTFTLRYRGEEITRPIKPVR